MNDQDTIFVIESCDHEYPMGKPLHDHCGHIQMFSDKLTALQTVRELGHPYPGCRFKVTDYIFKRKDPTE